MPIVTVQIVREAGEPDYPSATVHDLADALGVILGRGAASTWVRMTYLDSSQYAENEGQMELDVTPTFVEIISHSLPEEDVLAREASRVAETVAEILARPAAMVHIIFEPEAAGRIAFGGHLVRST